jgi:hypothetical protein
VYWEVVGSLRMYVGDLECFTSVSGGGGGGVHVVLCVCYGLVFYIHFSRCLVSCVLGMGLCNSCGMLFH